MNTKIIKIDVPQSKPTKHGSLLYQELDSSHVRRQTPDSLDAERSKKNKRFRYGQKPKMGREWRE